MPSPEAPISNPEIRRFMRDLYSDEYPLATLALENTFRDLERQANNTENVEELGRVLGQIPESDDE